MSCYVRGAIDSALVPHEDSKKAVATGCRRD